MGVNPLRGRFRRVVPSALRGWCASGSLYRNPVLYGTMTVRVRIECAYEELDLLRCRMPIGRAACRR